MNEFLKNLVILDEIERLSKQEIKSPSTSRIILDNYDLDGAIELLNIKSPGTIIELLVVATSSDYFIRIESDGKPVISDSFLDLNFISNYSNTIDAYVSDGKYIVSLTNIHFSEKIAVSIKGNTTITKLLLLYEVKK